MANLTDIRDEVIGGILLDKEFNVPEEVYDMVTCKALVKMFLSERKPMDWYLEQYLINPNAKEFFDFVKDNTPSNYLFFDAGKELTTVTNEIAFDGLLVIPRLLMFNKKDWYAYWKNLHKQDPGWWIEYFKIASDHPEFDHQCAEILSILFTYEYRDEIIFEKLKGYLDIENLVRLLYECEVYKSYERITSCIETNIPVLFYRPDETDVWIYLKTVLVSGYRGLLDPNIEPVIERCEINGIKEMLYEIGTTLNQDNLRYYFKLTKEKPSTMNVMKLLENGTVGSHGHHMSPRGRMMDFDTLITICGPNEHGLPIDGQILFLKQGGQIETMFHEDGTLKNEASIIKSFDQLSVLFGIINEKQLRFLLFNSTDFVKNILTSTWLTTNHYMKILKALLVYPLDEELWHVLNEPPTSIDEVDYRFRIVNKILTLFGADVIYNNVPEAMLYIEPSVLYITRNISVDNIKYMPVDKLVPYIQSFIGRRDTYEPLNLFCEGEYVSIQSAINDDYFLMKEIIYHKKYGYICDMKPADMKEVLRDMIRWAHIMQDGGDR